MPENPFALSRREIDDFHMRGFLGPYKLVDSQEMAKIKHYIDLRVLSADGPNPRNRLAMRHLDHRLLFDLCSHPAIVDRMECLFGNDLLLWGSHIFNKEPGGREIPWHQDFNFWPLDPPITVSAWIAIDEATQVNSCVRIIPGSHKRLIPHVKALPHMEFKEMADPAFVDEELAEAMEMCPGEFFLFNERLLHQSHANLSTKRRMGMTSRVTLPFVQILHHERPLFDGHRAILVRGHDFFKLNLLTDPPTT